MQKTLLFFFLFACHLGYSQQWQIYTTDNSGLPDNQVGLDDLVSLEEAEAIVVDHQNRIWMLPGKYPVKKLTRFDQVTNEWLTLDITDAPFAASGAEHFIAMYPDSNGHLWVTTESAAGFATYKYDGTQWTPGPVTGAWAYATDEDGVTWTVGLNEMFAPKLLQHKPGGAAEHSFTLNGYQTPGSNMYFFDIDFDASDNFWGVLWQLNGPTHSSLVKYREGFLPVEYTIGQKFLNCFDIQEDNDIWVGTTAFPSPFGGFDPASGIARLNGTSWEYFDTGNSSLPNDTIFTIKSGPSDRLWIGTANGLARFDEGKQEWKVFTPQNSPLRSGTITGINIDTLGNKWIGTLNGVARFNEITPVFSQAPACFRTVDFQDASQSIDGNIVAWHWDFGGHGTSADARPSFTFPAAGDYDVRLWVKDEKGNRNIIIQKITITDASPDLALSADSDPCATSTTITSNITDAALYTWTTPAGTSTGQSSLTAAATGRYVLAAQMANGCEKKDTIDITLNPATPGSFTITGNGIEGCQQTYPVGQSILFTNTTTGGNNFTWSFGTGEASTDPNPAHTFQQQGSYTIALNGTDDHGCSIRAQQVITVQTALELGPDVDTCEPSVTLDAGITEADSYTWHTPTGTLNGSGNTALTASASGDYALIFVKDGCRQSDNVHIRVTDAGEVDFTLSAAGKNIGNGAAILSGMEVACASTSGIPGSLTWSFGDNTSSTLEAPRHSYGEAGTYTISLSGTDDRNCTLHAEKTIEVYDIVITTAISPNGDGKNDKLFVEPMLFEASLKVIDRKGRTVYEADPYGDDFTGQHLENGIYFYELLFKEINKKYKGYVHIIR